MHYMYFFDQILASFVLSHGLYRDFVFSVFKEIKTNLILYLFRTLSAGRQVSKFEFRIFPYKKFSYFFFRQWILKNISINNSRKDIFTEVLSVHIDLILVKRLGQAYQQ